VGQYPAHVRPGVRTSAAAGRRLSGVPGRVQDGSGTMRCSWTQLDLMGHDPKPASRWPGTLRDYGRHTDRTRYSRGGKWGNGRSAAIPMGRDGLTVNLAYVVSNPTPATQNPRSGAVPVFPDAGSDVCSGSGSVDRSRLLWASGGPDLAWSAAHGGTGARDRSSGAVIHRTDLPVDISAGHWRVTGSGRRFRSSCVPLSPAAARTHDGRDSRRLRRFLWASGGQRMGRRACSICWLASGRSRVRARSRIPPITW
jgi:hypothetical protein